MFIEDCYKLGFVYKAYGIKGELIIRIDLQLSENIINKWESIFIEINGLLVPFFIEKIYQRSDIELQIKLEDIEDEIQAKIYTGDSIFIDKNLYEFPDEENIFFEWLAFIVSNKEGLIIGKISELLEFPGQNMLKICNPDSEDIIIPAIEDWIVSVDTEKKTICMDLPDGLIDLNQSTESLF